MLGRDATIRTVDLSTGSDPRISVFAETGQIEEN